jgi:protein arginine kinase activator
MLCDICHKNIATVHLTEIINDKVIEVHICQKCTKLKTEELKNQLSLSDFLSGLVEKEEVRRKPSLVCPLCKLTFNEFRKKGRLGCSNCYKMFKEQLLPLFRKIHGSTQHVGKFPKSVEDRILIERKIGQLREMLARAIKLEEYEEAARLRDKIKQLENKRGRKI